MGKFKTITSKTITVNFEENSDYVDADISIVFDNGKYGLSYNNKGNKDFLILPIEFENIFFIDSTCGVYIATVTNAKQGVYKLKAERVNNSNNVIAENILPCIYDNIQIGKLNGVLFLLKENKFFCYALMEEQILTECESVEEICPCYMLCINENEMELWYTYNIKHICTLSNKREDCCLYYIGDYEDGVVFKLSFWEDEERFERLLFCEHFGDKYQLSPKFSRIKATTKALGLNSNIVVDLQMELGNSEEILSSKTVYEFAKEEII